MNVQDPNNPTLVPAEQQSEQSTETQVVLPEMIDLSREDVPPSATGAVDEKSWAMGAHLSGLVGYIIPFGNVIVPIVILRMKKSESAFIAEHAKEAINFQISLLIYFAIAALLLLVAVSVGIFLLFALVVLDIIFIIIASIKANKGVQYTYPLAARFIT